MSLHLLRRLTTIETIRICTKQCPWCPLLQNKRPFAALLSKTTRQMNMMTPTDLTITMQSSGPSYCIGCIVAGDKM